MVNLVSEYMNKSLVYIQEDDRPDIALRPMLDLGITAVAVLDEDHRPIGVLTIRDLVDKKKTKRVTEPASTIGDESSIALAAKIMGDTGYHHLVVTNAAGKAVGMLSTLDVVRALSGQAPQHPTKITELSRARAS